LTKILLLRTLQTFPVVCLPHTGILSEHEAGLFRQYVEEGGNLIISGHAGLFDGTGRPLKALPYSRILLGRNAERKPKGQDNWMRFQETQAIKQSYSGLIKKIPFDWPFLVQGPAVIYKPITATAIGELLDSHRQSLVKPEAYNNEWPLSARKVVGPAVLINQIGKGKVLTFAGSPDKATAGEHHIVETRKLFANAVRFLNPNPRVRITAPANVEAVITDDPNERLLRIHLIAYNPPPQQRPLKIAPSYYQA
jgi:hypothetical protein